MRSRFTHSSHTTRPFRLRIINQQDILRQRRGDKVYSPSIPFLPSESRNIMFCVSPNLFCRPTLCAMRFVRDGKSPQNAFGGGKGGVFDVGRPSLAEERWGDVGEGFAFRGDEDRAEDMVRVFEVFGGESVNSGCSCRQSHWRNKNKLPSTNPAKAVFLNSIVSTGGSVVKECLSSSVIFH